MSSEVYVLRSLGDLRLDQGMVLIATNDSLDRPKALSTRPRRECNAKPACSRVVIVQTGIQYLHTMCRSKELLSNQQIYVSILLGKARH